MRGLLSALCVSAALVLGAAAPCTAQADSTAPAASDTIGPWHFADIPWGVSLDQVTLMLSGKGFTFSRFTEDSDVYYNGTLLGFPAVVVAFMGRHHLLQITVELLTKKDQTLPLYARLDTVLAAKYGPAVDSLSLYTAPYAAGDGREAEAFRTGNAMAAFLWYAPTIGNEETGLALSVTQNFTVGLSYSSAGWAAEEKRRNGGKGTKIF